METSIELHKLVRQYCINSFNIVTLLLINNFSRVFDELFSLYVYHTGMMTKVGLQDSASISTLLASIFGIIAFVILIITAALVLYVSLYFSIRRAKHTRKIHDNAS